jgi:hypothetical protein
MQEVLHLHPYRMTPSLEALDAKTLIDYLDATPQNSVYGNVVLRSQIETELLTHPALTKADHGKYKKLRTESDEMLTAHGYMIKDISTSVGQVFAPIVIGFGATPDSRWDMTYRRATRLLNKCENAFRNYPEFALGTSGELLFNLGIKGRGTMAVPSLTREDRGFTHNNKKFCWDSLLTSAGNILPAGNYRVQLKFSTSTEDYHTDIAVVLTNPNDEYHLDGRSFIDFVRLAIPGTRASHKELDRYHGRVRTMQAALRAHGPSRERKVRDRCLVEAA